MRFSVSAIAALLAGLLAGCSPAPEAETWTTEEAMLIASLSLSALPPLPPDPSNAVADNPEAAALGKALFFDTRLSANNQVSCGSCHLPERQFQDDLALAKGVGTTARRTMPIAGTAYSPWLFWDGRKDSQWAQALGPLESAVEHGTDRTSVAKLVQAHYASQYVSLFGALPDLSGMPDHAAPAGAAEVTTAWAGLDDRQRDAVNRVFANVGKAIAAFERTIMPAPTRFDAYAAALATGQSAEGLLSSEEQAGLRLFVGKGECTKCHNGPLLTDSYFHNTGVPAAPGLPDDLGRSVAIAQVKGDPFNCLGAYSDAGPGDCAELRYMTGDADEMLRAYKPPSLRGVADRPPFMHAGQLPTLAAVLEHYNAAPAAPAGHTELEPLAMSDAELAALVAFLGALSDADSAEIRP